MCGLALTGTVAGLPPDPVGAETARTLAPGEEGALLEECPPGPAGPAARVSDPDAAAPEGGELTPQQAEDYDRRFREALVPLRGQEIQAPRSVPVVVHVISAEDGRGDVPQARVEDQIEVLNTAFSGGYATEGADTGFRFELTETTRTVDDTWFTRFDEHRDTIRAELHRGGAGTLNVYTAQLGTGLLGYSSFPQDYEAAPDQDGVVLSHDTLPGGGRDGFDLGHTGTHEVGHWLGLFHTFQNGCASPGDYVDDTPYEREAASGCPVGRDSCPRQRGDDPVTNFMNYSDDGCMTHFTEGQARRIVEHWAAFRS
ncbi:zinc metalloprotease [Nocardiopsis sp. NPDC101807]|uniref:zinc metalloprotease n=1 Tax=Nocardiopsis sp. NPDC101807 TaxID=3364339 RepID=UPI0037F3CF1A